MILGIDTESTGLFDERSDDAAPHQPRLVRVCCALYDGEREAALIDLTMKPDGWTIPENVAALHGVTQRLATQIGVPVRSALSAVINLSKAATTVLFYSTYETRLIAAELRRMKVATPFPEPGVERVDVMRLATEWCKLPHKNGGDGYKFPKLTEAAKIILDEEIPAHECLSDMRATYRVWKAIKLREAA